MDSVTLLKRQTVVGVAPPPTEKIEHPSSSSSNLPEERF